MTQRNNGNLETRLDQIKVALQTFKLTISDYGVSTPEQFNVFLREPYESIERDLLDSRVDEDSCLHDQYQKLIAEYTELGYVLDMKEMQVGESPEQYRMPRDDTLRMMATRVWEKLPRGRVFKGGIAAAILVLVTTGIGILNYSSDSVRSQQAEDNINSTSMIDVSRKDKIKKTVKKKQRRLKKVEPPKKKGPRYVRIGSPREEAYYTIKGIDIVMDTQECSVFIPDIETQPVVRTKGKKTKGRLLNGIRLPNSNARRNYVHSKSVQTRNHKAEYGTADLIAATLIAGCKHRKFTRVPINVGDFSEDGGGDVSGHVSHELGVDVDVYQTGAVKPININSYDDMVNCISSLRGVDYIIKNGVIQKVCIDYVVDKKGRAITFDAVNALAEREIRWVNGKKQKIFFPLHANWILVRSIAEYKNAQPMYIRLDDYRGETKLVVSTNQDPNAHSYIKYGGEIEEQEPIYEEEYLKFTIFYPTLKRSLLSFAEKEMNAQTGKHSDAYTRVKHSFLIFRGKEDWTHRNHFHFRNVPGGFPYQKYRQK